ncbi:MAG: pirin family protein, partial [Bacteroidota bacterium]
FILNGSIKHFDTKLNDWKTLKAGDAQIIRSGNGISHSEFMAKDAVMFQIWLDPNLDKTLSQEASYNDYYAEDFKVIKTNGIARKIYAGEEGLMYLDSPGVQIEEWTLLEGHFNYTNTQGELLSIYNLGSDMKMNGQTFAAHSFAIIENNESILLERDGEGRLFVIKSPKELTYNTYSQRLMS